MKLNSNRWNRLRYTLWAPVYDALVGSLGEARRQSLGMLGVQPGERVLLVGAGTGADLPYMEAGCRVLATDLTPAMLRAATSHARPGVRFALMDGQRLAVTEGRFDAVVLHLILAVIPDPVACLREASRALRAGGRVVVFDKFVRAGRVPLAVRVVNPLARVLFTEMTRDFEEILARAGAPLAVVRDEPAFLGRLYRRILLHKAA
jgi:ubiquinone/menaquinone biosynthesis C-methylase UbiE